MLRLPKRFANVPQGQKVLAFCFSRVQNVVRHRLKLKSVKTFEDRVTNKLVGYNVNGGRRIHSNEDFHILRNCPL